MIDRTWRLGRNAARAKEFERIVPHRIVIEVKVNANSARALEDPGSLSDFISAKLVDQLNIPTFALDKPIPVQLATTGSRTVVNCSVEREMAYQNMKEKRNMDVISLDEYGIVLGTPFPFQCKVPNSSRDELCRPCPRNASRDNPAKDSGYIGGSSGFFAKAIAGGSERFVGKSGGHATATSESY